jgi:hypothetical protein
MKCVCGYKHERGIDENGDWQENLIGDEAFIEIEEKIIYLSFGGTKRLYIYGCPKCQTIRFEGDCFY